MEKAILKHAEKAYYNGQQDTYTNGEGKKYYKYNVTLTKSDNTEITGYKYMEDPDHKFVTGKEYEYETEQDKKNNTKFKVLRKVKEDNGYGGGNSFKSRYDDPKVQKAITRKTCYALAVSYFIDNTNITTETFQEEAMLKNSTKVMADKMVEYCYTGVGEKENDKLLNRRSALEIAVHAKNIPGMKIMAPTELFAYAEEIMTYISAE